MSLGKQCLPTVEWIAVWKPANMRIGNANGKYGPEISIWESSALSWEVKPGEFRGL